MRGDSESTTVTAEATQESAFDIASVELLPATCALGRNIQLERGEASAGPYEISVWQSSSGDVTGDNVDDIAFIVSCSDERWVRTEPWIWLSDAGLAQVPVVIGPLLTSPEGETWFDGVESIELVDGRVVLTWWLHKGDLPSEFPSSVVRTEFEVDGLVLREVASFETSPLTVANHALRVAAGGSVEKEGWITSFLVDHFGEAPLQGDLSMVSACELTESVNPQWRCMAADGSFVVIVDYVGGVVWEPGALRATSVRLLSPD